MTNRFVSPEQQFLNFVGQPYAGGLLYFYVTETSTLTDTYQDEALTTPNLNPVPLDSAGYSGNIFLDSSVIYKVVLKDANGNLIWTFDPVIPTDNSANMGSSPLVSCTATGLNSITLTPIISGQQPSAYANFMVFAFVPAGTSSGDVIAKVGTLAYYPVYSSPGIQATTGSFVGGSGPYFIAYGSTVAGSSPGFLMLNNPIPGWGLDPGPSISQTAPPYSFGLPINMGLSASVVSNTLTITLTTASGAIPSTINPVLVPFRSTSDSVGTVIWVAITSALSITIPASATLGTTNMVPFRIWIFLEYNAGAPELAVATCSLPSGQIFPASAWEVNGVTTTTISSGATVAGTPYSTSGVASDPIQIIGYAEYGSGLATVGTWNSSPTRLKVMGPGTKKPGDVVQVASNFTTTVGSTTSIGTFVALTSGQSQVITPTSAANYIRVAGSGAIQMSTSQQGYVQVARGSILVGTVQTMEATSGGNFGNTNFLYYDAPEVATAITYSIYGKVGGSATMFYPPSGFGAFLELQEIMG